MPGTFFHTDDIQSNPAGGNDALCAAAVGVFHRAGHMCYAARHSSESASGLELTRSGWIAAQHRVRHLCQAQFGASREHAQASINERSIATSTPNTGCGTVLGRPV